MAFCLACGGVYKWALEAFEEATKHNPYYPWWLNICPFLCYYHQQDYEEALNYAKKMNCPDLFWDPMLRAATLGRLDRKAEAQQTIDELQRLDPDIAGHAKVALGMLLIPNDMIADLLDGLSKAGLDCPNELTGTDPQNGKLSKLK